MKRMAWLVVAAVCALCVAAFVGCGSGASSSSASAGSASASAEASSAASASAEASSAASSAASAASSAAAQSDEDQIRADFQSTMDTLLTPETIIAAMGTGNESLATLEALGIDMNELVELILDRISFEPKDVQVNGDTAQLTVAITSPDFNSSNDFMNQKVEAALADVDVENMTEEQAIALIAEVLRTVLTDPDMPMTTEDAVVEYVKKDGVWTMAESDEITAALSGVAGA